MDVTSTGKHYGRVERKIPNRGSVVNISEGLEFSRLFVFLQNKKVDMQALIRRPERLEGRQRLRLMLGLLARVQTTSEHTSLTYRTTCKSSYAFYIDCSTVVDSAVYDGRKPK